MTWCGIMRWNHVLPSLTSHHQVAVADQGSWHPHQQKNVCAAWLCLFLNTEFIDLCELRSIWRFRTVSIKLQRQCFWIHRHSALRTDLPRRQGNWLYTSGVQGVTIGQPVIMMWSSEETKQTKRTYFNTWQHARLPGLLMLYSAPCYYNCSCCK